MTHDTEVLVVGAGPAGATAARALALAGVRTLLVDRARFPRTKPCGGAITVRALARFPHLSPVLERIPTHWISALDLESPDGAVAHLRSPRPAVFMIRRVEFDAALVAAATDSGARLAEGIDVCGIKEDHDGVEVATRDGHRFRAAMVIGADGVHGIVARRLGLFHGWQRDAVAVDMMEEAPASQLAAVRDDTLWVGYGYELHSAQLAAPLHRGYAYVFPKTGHTNVGIGYLASNYRQAAPRRAFDLYDGFVSRLKERGVLRGTPSRAQFTPFLIPVGGPLRQTGTARTLVAGDAGGFVNAFTAEGIYYAMVTGDLAARACVSRLRRGQDARDTYRALWREAIGAELRDSVAVQHLLLNRKGWIDRMVREVGKSPSLVDPIIHWATGADSYRRLRRDLAWRHPVARLFLAGVAAKYTLSDC